jgi:hypothetical protein
MQHAACSILPFLFSYAAMLALLLHAFLLCSFRHCCILFFYIIILFYFFFLSHNTFSLKRSLYWN